MSQRIAILGFGCAGYHAAKALRECGCMGEVHVYTDSVLPPANPMLTTYYAGGKLPYEGMFPFGTDLEDIAHGLDLTLHSARRVVRLHAAERVVETDDGERAAFDKVLIATGAFAILPPVGDVPPERIFLMRTVEDAVRLRARLARVGVKKAVVVGASMVGIKVAEVLKNAGVACLMADMAQRIFPLAALPEVSTEIERRVAAAGVELRFGSALNELTERSGRLTGKIGGETVEADLVVYCIGTRPNLGFLDSTEIRIDRAVVVDDLMRTSVPGVYAAGDCCAGGNLQTGAPQIIGLWANAGCQGRAAGCAMAGKEAPYEGTILHNITHFMGMDFIGFGDALAQGETLDWRSPDGGFWLRAVMQDGRPACVNILDNYVISGPIKHYLLKLFAGGAEEFVPAQRGMLERCGVPPAILERLEGRT